MDNRIQRIIIRPDEDSDTESEEEMDYEEGGGVVVGKLVGGGGGGKGEDVLEESDVLAVPLDSSDEDPLT